MTQQSSIFISFKWVVYNLGIDLIDDFVLIDDGVLNYYLEAAVVLDVKPHGSAPLQFVFCEPLLQVFQP